MTSEPKDFVRPSRSGRMRGVRVVIDQDTWEYVLQQAKIPKDTPLGKLKLRRYRSKAGAIILKVMRED